MFRKSMCVAAFFYVLVIGPNWTQAAALMPGDILVSDFGLKAVVRVDPVTGNRTIFSGVDAGVGPNFIIPRGLVIDANGNILVADTNLRAILSVDPFTGSRTVVSSSNPAGIVGGGADFDSIGGGIALDASGNIFASSSRDIYGIDPVTGDRTIVFDGTIGSQTGDLNGLAMGTSGAILVVNNRANNDSADAVASIDLVTGNPTILSSSSIALGPPFINPRGIALDATGDILLADEGFFSLPAVFRINPVTGDRSIISSPLVGFGTDFMRPIDVAVDASGNILVTDDGLGREAVFRVDPVTGGRTIVSGNGVGSGPNFISPFSIAIVPAEGTPEPSSPTLISELLIFSPLATLAVAGDVEITAGAEVGVTPDYSQTSATLETILAVTHTGTLTGLFANEGEHLRDGLFVDAIAYNPNDVTVNILQAAPGDVNGDRIVNSADIQLILSANSFNNGSGFDWTHGDNNGDGLVNSTDIQNILTTNLFGKLAYAALPGNAAVVPEPNSLVFAIVALLGLVACGRRKRSTPPLGTAPSW